MTGMKLASPAFTDRDRMPTRFSHDHDNISPPLLWSGLPDSTTELLLLCEDPDAPGDTFLHWLVTGIDPSSDGIGEGQTPPSGREWPNSFGEQGWSGPQPPPGDRPHRYVFQLFALAEPIQLPAEPTAADVHRHVDATALASGMTSGLYQR